MKFKFTFKIWVLILVLIFSLISIFVTPNFLQKGVLIASVESNSTAFEQGLRQGQVITYIDNQEIASVEDFSNIIQQKFVSGENIKTIIQTKDSEYVLYSTSPPDIVVEEIPLTNVQTGLDLAGGSRALVQAKDQKLSLEEVKDLASIANNRFNVYGISDINIRPVSDLSGNYFMLVEIAGATPSDLEKLISEQGEFEAKIGEDTVFVGGDKDITSVVRSGQSSGVYSCSQYQEGYVCYFRFVVYLSEEAATRHAEITDKLEVNHTSEGDYLSKKLDLYLDGKIVNSLQISSDLKGRVTTQIQVSGSSTGLTKDEAIKNAEEEMNQMQTVLITGSLPFKLEIVKLDTISPTLGNEFIKNILIAGGLALIAILLIVSFRYKKFKFSCALLITSISEIIIVLGIAALINWDLDLPSIAGILAAIGTGIDSQIIVLDEAQQQSENSNIKQKLKRAFSIILGAYFTALAALIPLYWAVAGLFKGFAVTTIIGITVGVLITRPAFTDIIKNLEE